MFQTKLNILLIQLEVIGQLKFRIVIWKKEEVGRGKIPWESDLHLQLGQVDGNLDKGMMQVAGLGVFSELTSNL